MKPGAPELSPLVRERGDLSVLSSTARLVSCRGSNASKVTRGDAHGVPERLRDAVESLEEGKRLISGTPTLRQVARGA